MIDPAAVRSREDLSRFVRSLADDLRQRPAEWENADLSSFLDAMSAWVDDMDGFFRSRGEPIPAQPDWRTFAEILAAARVYE